MTLHSNIQNMPLQVCLCARDLSAFSLLVEDLHSELGENWGELTPAETVNFLKDQPGTDLKLLIVAVDEDDRDNLVEIEHIIASARRYGLASLLIAEDLTELELYQLTQCGATPHIQYPLQEGELSVALADTAPELVRPLVEKITHGQVVAVQGIAGGAGSSTLAINIARELSALGTGSVCLLDLDVQFGSIGLELGLPDRETALDLLFDEGIISPEWLEDALQDFGPNMKVLTAPTEVVPLDRVAPVGLIKLLAMAQSQFDHVVVDMPKTISSWTTVVFDWADTVFCPVIPGKKAPSLVERFRETCLDEGLPLEKVQFIANRIKPEGGKTTVDDINQLAEAAGGPLKVILPEGRYDVGQSSSFAPLSAVTPDDDLAQEFNRLAKGLSEKRAIAA